MIIMPTIAIMIAQTDMDKSINTSIILRALMDKIIKDLYHLILIVWWGKEQHMGHLVIQNTL